MDNVFTITKSDGSLNGSPNGEFTDTSSLPSDPKVLIKGTSDILCVNDGLPGFCGSANYYVEENGEPAQTEGQTAWLNDGNPSLKGKTIYGYIITYGTKPRQTGTLEGYIINFITDVNYKTGEAVYQGWGRTGIQITVDEGILNPYTIKGVTNSMAASSIQANYAPIMFSYFTGNGQMGIPYIAIKNGVFKIGYLLISRVYNPVQGVNDSNYINTYGPTSITILDSDIIIPSLEDRVTALEEKVAALPNDIKAALVVAVEEVSKLYVAR